MIITEQFVNNLLEKIDNKSESTKTIPKNEKSNKKNPNIKNIVKKEEDILKKSTKKNITIEYDNSVLNNEKIWKFVIEKLRKNYGEDAYNSWLKSINLVSYQKGILNLSVFTKFKREMIINQSFDKKIMNYWKEKSNSIKHVNINIKNHSDNLANKNLQNKDGSKISYPGSPIIEKKDYSINSKFTFDNFIVGKSNELAFAAAKRIAENDYIIDGTNPLFLYGGVGLGKTHLMNAIGNHIKNHSSKRKVMYLSAERFMYKYIIALKNKDIMEFKEELRSVDVLMVDDVQFISGKNSTQEEFFHTFNSLIEQKKQLVISADRSPSDLDGIEDRIKSRLGWGLVADIHDATYELRLGILQSKAEEMSLHIPDKVISFIAKNIDSNIRVLEGALYKVIHLASLGRAITMESVEEALSDLIRANKKLITLDDIIKAVSNHFNVKISDLKSTRRTRNIVYPRQIAMYLSKILTKKSLLDIGRSFGGRDHTTVIHSVKKIEKKIKDDKEIESDIRILEKSL